ncbi:MAG TPA: hypothetical protein VE127_06465 [Solirubrobacteraceae bacterium]|nr:hypothetical protein [Solirubrobacteraceae bacterium]
MSRTLTVLGTRRQPGTRRAARGPATALVAIALTLLAAYGAIQLTQGGAQQVSLQTLVLDQPQYVGQKITTTGTVQRFTDPDGSSYYMLTDRQQDRVIIHPAAAAASYLHRRVTITGTFTFEPSAGRILNAHRVHAG